MTETEIKQRIDEIDRKIERFFERWNAYKGYDVDEFYNEKINELEREKRNLEDQL